MPNKLDFPKGEGLDVHIIIYVPSTKNITKKITKLAFKRRINSTVVFLRKEFGGSTRVAGVGDFKLTKKRFIEEEVAKVETFTTIDDYKKSDKKIRAWLKRKKKAWSQKALSYEFEETLYFV